MYYSVSKMRRILFLLYIVMRVKIYLRLEIIYAIGVFTIIKCFIKLLYTYIATLPEEGSMYNNENQK